MKKELTFELHKSKILNSNKKLHHMAHGNIVRFLRGQANDLGREMLETSPQTFDKFKVAITVCPPTRRRLDPANLWPTAKALVDGLTDAEWWIDDDFSHLLEIGFRYGGLSGIKETFLIKLVVEELSTEEVLGYILESEVAIVKQEKGIEK